MIICRLSLVYVYFLCFGPHNPELTGYKFLGRKFFRDLTRAMCLESNKGMSVHVIACIS